VKKEYKKPLVAVEHFPMVYTSARDCMDNIAQDQLTLGEISNCGWVLGDIVVFVTSDISRAQSCTLDGAIFEENLDVCYNNPGEGRYIFRS
jgi:hypothetical protein